MIFLAEFIGSVFLTIAAVAPMFLFVYVFESPLGVALIANAIAVAWVLCALIEIFLPISGGILTPPLHSRRGARRRLVRKTPFCMCWCR